MSQLLKKAASPEVLNHSWKSLKNDRAMWSESISRKEMEKNIVLHLTTLADDLRNGSYKPSNVRFSTITKASGKKRIISAFTLRDKIAQRAVLSVIEEYGEKIFHADSYAYRKGRSIEMAVSKAREYIFCHMEWLVDADIQNFFDEIPHAKLKKTLTKVLPDAGIVKLIHKWIDVGSTKTGIRQKRRGIPQGGLCKALHKAPCGVPVFVWYFRPFSM
jgi:retron-type reverse transcriptase